ASLEVVRIDVAAILDVGGDRVGQLDLSAGAALGAFQRLEDAARQDVAADHGQVAGGILRLRLLHHGLDAAAAAFEVTGGDDAVAGGLLVRHLLDGDDATAGLLGQVGHLLEGAVAAVPHQVVGEQHRERLVADHVPGAKYRVAKA